MKERAELKLRMLEKEFWQSLEAWHCIVDDETNPAWREDLASAERKIRNIEIEYGRYCNEFMTKYGNHEKRG